MDHKHKEKRKEVVVKKDSSSSTPSTPDSRENTPPEEKKEERHAKGKAHDHYKRSESYSDSNRFFHHARNNNQGIKQEVKVTVNIEQAKDDDGCWSSLMKCFGKGAVA